MHKTYPTKKTLQRFNIGINYSCAFCGLEEETICHLFYNCMCTTIFCWDVQNYIIRKAEKTIRCTEKCINIYFEGKEKYFLYSCPFFREIFIHIRKKWSESKPSFVHFLNELEQYYSTISGLNKRKALNTTSVKDKDYKT